MPPLRARFPPCAACHFIYAVSLNWKVKSSREKRTRHLVNLSYRRRLEQKGPTISKRFRLIAVHAIHSNVATFSES
jgi:hypothetical protein